MSANITAAQVQELRERTGAGFMDCKTALLEANGNIEEAIEAMKIKGTAKAAKKAGRIAAEGRIASYVASDGHLAALVEVNCETDFVGRDASFGEFVDKVARRALETQAADPARLLEQTLSTTSQESIEHARQQLISKLGENIQIRRVALIKASGIIGSYVHGGRIGALAAITVANPELAKDLAMHIAAANPIAIAEKDVPAELIAKEKEIFAAQSAQSDKPAEIVEKMIAGRINKYLSEVSLLGQPFVKDSSKTVGVLLSEAKAEVTAFARFELGEGIEKPTEDFAKEVMTQVGGGH